MSTINLDNKTILVTGAAGFIGSNLVKRIYQEAPSATVVGIDNMNDYYDVALKEFRLNELAKYPTFTFVKGNIADKALITELFKKYKPSVVVNLAAQAGVRYSITNPDAYVESNLVGFFNILEACRHCESLEHLVYASSFFEKYDDIISFEEWCHFYIRHGEYLKTKELYDSVFDERKYLIEDQPEYFYRSYIDFTLAHQFDLTPALRCFVEHSDEFKDIFIYMSFEMDLKFATCTFNDPDQMLDDVKILLDEGLYTEADYNEKCLIINMLNCRPVQAEQYAGWAHGMHPLLSSKYERMLLVWKGAQVMPNTHWNSMQQWIASQMFDVYKKEKWLRNPKDILFESCTSENKAIVVDLWTLYFFVKVQAQEVMSHFKTIYITYDTVSMALQEINQVNDDDIRRVLIHLQREGNVKLLSPTLEQQLTVRNPSYNFMEVHSACLLAQELNCPAFVGEFRFEIPEQLRSKVIRPDNLKEVMDCVMDKKLLEAE